jgi:hypothetical protein
MSSGAGVVVIVGAYRRARDVGCASRLLNSV